MNKSKIKFGLLLSIISLGLVSCGKDEVESVETENYKGIFVVNEGGFNKSNGTVGLYKPGTKAYFDAFKKANNRPLGDVVQSMALINDRFYVLVNNSNKIEVVGKSDFKTVSTLSVSSPRYIVKTGDNKAYISNFYKNSVQVLNLGTNTIESSININHWSENMAVSNGFTFVGTTDNKIMVIKNDSNLLRDSISTPSGLGKIVNTSSGKLAVLCTGLVDWNDGSVLENGNILIINDSNKISNTFPLSTGSYGGSMVYSPSTGKLYFSLGNNKVEAMDMNGNKSDFITLPTGVSVYGLSIGNAGEIYVLDAGDFNSSGKVYVYSSDGTKYNQFDAGIAPNSVLINE